MLSLKPTVSIIFPNFNGGQQPLDCIYSIKKLDYPQQKLEIIVVDNNSQDGSREKIRKLFKKVKIIENKTNLGFAKAINQGAEIAKGDYIFITNDDIIFEKNSLQKSVDYLLKTKDAGLVGGKIYYKNKPKKICSNGFIMNKWTGNVHTAPYPNQINQPDWVQGCAILISKKLFNEVGKLDPNFFLSFDDYDLCQRLKNRSFKVFYYPEAIFWHGESITTDKNKPFKYYHWYKSKFYFIFKHLPPINIISIVLIQLTLITPYRALVLRDGRFIPFIKGFFWNLKNFNNTLNSRKKYV